MARRLASLLGLGQNERISIIKLFLDSGEQSLTKSEAKELLDIAASKSLTQDLAVFQSYLTYHANRGNVSEVKEGLRVLAPRYKFTPTESWNSFLIKAHTQNGDVVAAQELLRTLSHRDRERAKTEEGSRMHEMLYMDLMQALARVNRRGKAIALFERMTSRGVQASARAYELTIGLHLDLNDSNEAGKMLKTMREQGLVPSTDIINRMLTAKAAVYRYKDCFDIFEECKRRGPQCDFRMYNSLLASLRYTHSNENVVKVFDEMRASMRPAREQYRWAIDASGYSRRRHKTKVLWAKMREDFGKEKLTEEDYTTYMIACARAHDLDEATRALEEMHNAGLPRTHHTAFAMMAIIAVDHKNIEMARTHFESLRTSGYLPKSVEPWNQMINMLMRNNDVIDARTLFDEMRTQRNPAPDSTSYLSIIRNANDNQEMLQLMEEMKENKVYIDARIYFAVAQKLITNGDMKTATEVIGEMRNAGFVIPISFASNIKIT